jgi:hypothetical protein
MLDDILKIKSILKNEFEGITPTIEEYYEKIEELDRVFLLNLSSKSHWRVYIHSSLISLYLELKGYDLVYWNEYFSKIDRISRFFGFSPPREGDILESFVLHTVNKVFDFKDDEYEIVALKANDSKNPVYLTDDTSNPNLLSNEVNQRLIGNLKIVMRIRGVPRKEIWGDNDVIIVLKFQGVIQQFCIVSCKTSLRERVYQSVFWSMHSRLEGIGKHVFFTLDKGQSGSTEIGSRSGNNSAKKSRDVLESTMDRVYVLRTQSEVSRSQVIKDFSHFRIDLLDWAKEITGT